METTKINRNGNSKAVNLPAPFCRKLGIQIGDFVNCWLTVKDEIVIIRADEKRKPSWLKEK